jgi:hypothetical protein
MEKSKSMSGELLRAMADLHILENHLSRHRGRCFGLGLIQRRPAVVEGFTAVPRKAVCQPNGRASAFDGVNG